MTGQTVSRYELLEELGRGGMGIVYKARDLRLQRIVALKLLSPGKLADQECRRRLVREARTASALNHVNIVTVHDVDQWNGVDFIAMEYVAGESLQKLIEAGKLPLRNAIDYGMQIARALSAAHAAGVIHCDLKPGNVMISQDGLVKILDFGLSTFRQPFPTTDDSTASFDRQSVPGVLCGTPPYMSPEQIEGKPADTLTDIFAFGVLLYEMVTARPAFRRNSVAATFAAILQAEPPPLSQYGTSAPPALQHMVSSCLQKDPKRRVGSIQEVGLSLQELNEEMAAPKNMARAVNATGPMGPGSRRARVLEAQVARILVVEDDPGIALGLEDDLTLEGYDVVVASDGEIASLRAREEKFDLILLDIMLPRKSGFDVCRELRRAGIRTPIVMLTAKAQETEKVMGLDLGADDYVTKPFSPHELRARVRALLRRAAEPPPEVYVFGDNAVDFSRGELRRHGKVVQLTPLEFGLITALVRNRGRLLSRNQLLEQVWGPGVSVIDRVVDNQILGLRKKIEADPARPRYLVSVRGMGYRFDA